jgi:hypothetical protein
VTWCVRLVGLASIAAAVAYLSLSTTPVYTVATGKRTALSPKTYPKFVPFGSQRQKGTRYLLAVWRYRNRPGLAPACIRRVEIPLLGVHGKPRNPAGGGTAPIIAIQAQAQTCNNLWLRPTPTHHYRPRTKFPNRNNVNFKWYPVAGRLVSMIVPEATTENRRQPCAPRQALSRKHHRGRTTCNLPTDNDDCG